MTPRARKEWIQSTQFHELSDREVLNEVIARSKKAGPAGIVILDLDSTLYEVSHRTFNILLEWADHTDSDPFESVSASLRKTELKHVGYSLDDTFSAVGIDLNLADTQSALLAAKAFWKKRFFSNEYLVHDQPYEGAPAFVRALHATGIQIAYLTGRDEPGMGQVTREKLKKDGFPIHAEHIHFYLKPQREGDDHDFKVAAAKEIQKRGKVVASFENEPRNVMGLYNLFSEAMHIFVETHCSDHEAQPGKGLYRIRSYEGF